MVTEGGHWYDGIANRADEVRNYHSENDDVIGPDFGGADDTALGAEGAPDSAATPNTYMDVDVTDAVENHGAYMSSSALGQDLAAAITDDEGPPPIGDSASAPTDPNGDGLYTDITGDGETTHDDVETLLANLDDDAVETNAEYFDFADNGTVGFRDVIALMRRSNMTGPTGIDALERRRLLQAIGAGTLGAVGLAGTSGSALATSDDELSYENPLYGPDFADPAVHRDDDGTWWAYART